MPRPPHQLKLFQPIETINNKLINSKPAMNRTKIPSNRGNHSTVIKTL